MPGNRRIAIVCNPVAGKGKALRVCRQICEYLSQQDIPFTCFTSRWPEHFNDFTEVFLSGGDGTLNYFINHYPNINIPLFIFKGGSGNDFAWKLYGNLSFEEQLHRALNGTDRSVDAGICNKHLFINGVGIGFDGEVVKAMMRKLFFLDGHAAYLWTVLKKIFSYREKPVQLEYNGMQRVKDIFMISIANGSRYGGGFLVAPQADPTDGELDMVIIHRIHPLLRFFHLPKVEKGKHLSLSFIETGKVKKICIRSQQVITAHVDGELIEDNHFAIEILPGRFVFRC